MERTNRRVERLIDQMEKRGARHDGVVKLFIGWTRKTDDFEEELVERLTPDIQREHIAIVDELRAADIFTPLVCAGNIVSPEFEEEIEAALERAGQLVILPIWLFPIGGVHYLQSILATFPGLPGRDRTWFEGPDREETWAEVLRGIRYTASRLLDYRNLRNP